MSQKRTSSDFDWKHFISLSDPVRSVPDTIKSAEWPDLLALAAKHGVLPIFLRKLNNHPDRNHLIGLLPDTLRKELDKDGVISLGLTMMLEHHYRAIQEKIGNKKLRAVVVKGPVFAARLYQHANDRPFTDIDLLAHPDDIEPIGQVLTGLGFNRFKKGFWDRSDIYQEQKWLLSGNSNVMIELHGNLVHYPSLRRGVSFGYADYQVASQSDGESVLPLFMTAVVHASLGHKFHKLQLLVDILQAYRNLSSEQRDQLPAAAKVLSMRLETALCLELIADLYAEGDARMLAEAVAFRTQSRIATRLVSPLTVLDIHGESATRSRIRRHAFRWLQSMHLGRR